MMLGSYVLRRRADHLFFMDAHTNDQREEWTAEIQNARRWVDLESCHAAASTWLAIKHQELEVINV